MLMECDNFYKTHTCDGRASYFCRNCMKEICKSCLQIYHKEHLFYLVPTEGIVDDYKVELDQKTMKNSNTQISDDVSKEVDEIYRIKLNKIREVSLQKIQMIQRLATVCISILNKESDVEISNEKYKLDVVLSKINEEMVLKASMTNCDFSSKF